MGPLAPSPIFAAGYALPDSTFGFGTCCVSWSRSADGRWLVALPGLSGTRYLDCVIDDFGNLVEAVGPPASAGVDVRSLGPLRQKLATIFSEDTEDKPPNRAASRAVAGPAAEWGTEDRLRTK